MKRLVLAALAAALVSSSALAADIGPSRGYTYKPAYNAPFSWTGFYVGGTVGYGRTKGDASSDFGGLASFDSTTTGTGIVGGATLGYNYQFGNFVVGLESDLNFGSQKGSSSQDILVGGFIPVNVATQGSLDWYTTLRGRLGYNINGWLPYLTAGYAYGGATASCQVSVIGIQVGGCNESHRVGGLAYGGGVEYAFNRSWSAKIEYMHLDFNSFDMPVTTILGTTNASVKLSDDIIRAGINYRF